MGGVGFLGEVGMVVMRVLVVRVVIKMLVCMVMVGLRRRLDGVGDRVGEVG